MRDKHYKVKRFRLSDEVYQKLEKAKKQTGKSWNLFLREILERGNASL
jgi:predicted DNA-binding protein